MADKVPVEIALPLLTDELSCDDPAPLVPICVWLAPVPSSEWSRACRYNPTVRFTAIQLRSASLLLQSPNYRKRVLHAVAEELKLPRLTFQIIRRSIVTLAQKKGTAKDVQGLLRHSRAATTTDVYMKEIPESVQATVDSINQELRKKARRKIERKEGSEKFATKSETAMSVSA